MNRLRGNLVWKSPRICEKYPVLLTARTPTTWVTQWRMDCRELIQARLTLSRFAVTPHHRAGREALIMKTRKLIERRARRRFELALTVQFRLTRKRSAARWGTGTIHDMSSSGINFQCRGPLPVGCHLELTIVWPATREQYPMRLRATGFVVRSTSTKTAIQITWHRLGIEPVETIPISAQIGRAHV